GGENVFLVYDREGEPCATCRTPIERIVQGGRSTYYCPSCQPRWKRRATPRTGPARSPARASTAARPPRRLPARRLVVLQGDRPARRPVSAGQKRRR
ncbi:MAG: zinc finger domain-containing protein, partial [Myxococcales bacterium]